MKKLIALICLYSFSLNSIANTFEPFSTTFFLRQHASDRDVIELVACSTHEKALGEQGLGSFLFSDDCQSFGNEEGYSLELIERLEIFSAASAKDFATKKASNLEVGEILGTLSVVAFSLLAFATAALAFAMQGNINAKDSILRKAGAILIPAIPSAAIAIGFNRRAVNHFDVDTYEELGGSIDNIDYRELEQAEIIYFSLASVDRGPGGERPYKKKVNQVENALVHILKDAEIQ